MKGKIKAWITATRPFAAPWMVFNTLFGVTLAGFDSGKWLLAFLTVTSVLIGGHFLNSWRDFVKGIDKVVEGSIPKPYTMGSQVLPLGLLSLDTIRNSAILWFLVSLSFVVLAPVRADIWILYGIGVIMALTYTDFWKVKGLGEVALFVGHGFATVGFSYALVKPLDITGVAGGLMIGVLIGLVYTIDQWQDVDTDFGRKVKNLAGIIFRTDMKISQYWFFAATGSIVFQFGLVLFGWLPIYTLGTVFLLMFAPIIGVFLDYDFDKGILMAVLYLWLVPAFAAFGLLFF